MNLQSKQETIRELRSVNELVGNQFLVVSEEYMMLVYEEEERKKGAGLAPRGGEPGGPEEEAQKGEPGPYEPATEDTSLE